MPLKMWTLSANTCRFLQETFLGSAVALRWKPSATTTVTVLGGWLASEKQVGDKTARSLEIALVLRIAYQQKPLPVAGTHKSPCFVCIWPERCIQGGPCAPAQSPPAPHSLLWLQLSAPWGWAGDGLSVQGPQALQDTPSSCHLYMRWHTHHGPVQLLAALMAHGPGRLSQLLLSSKKTISGHLACSVKQPLCDILSATNNWERPT